MRIAVTYENGTVFQHFGHTEQFMIFDVENGKVAEKSIASTNGSGHGALADFLKDKQVDTLICGGIGGGAKAALEAAGIRFYAGVTGSAEAAVEALLADRLAYRTDATCDHHEHSHEHHHHQEGGCGGHGHDCRHGNCNG